MTPLAPRRDGIALFCIVAIACFLAASSGLAARMSIRAADAWNSAIRGALTVRVVAPETPEAVSEVAAALRTAPGVFSARAVTPERAAALLERWAGPGVRAEDLPSLRLIEVEIDKSQATPVYAKTLERALAATGYQAEVYGPGPWADTAANTASRYQAIALGVALLLGATALITAGLAGRARAFADRALVPPMADVGAARGRVAREFAARSAVEGFLAGLLGAVFAAILAAWLLRELMPHLSVDQWSLVFKPIDLTPLLAAPLLAALLTGAGARAAANRLYRRAAKLT